jgi:hypothetical protein
MLNQWLITPQNERIATRLKSLLAFGRGDKIFAPKQIVREFSAFKMRGGE